jgi:hypothetical protein
MPGCPVEVPGMALDSYVTSMYLTGHPGMALDPDVTSMYPTGYPALPSTPT